MKDIYTKPKIKVLTCQTEYSLLAPSKWKVGNDPSINIHQATPNEDPDAKAWDFEEDEY
ncbi:MAG: hypothetical protein PUK16_06720 [Prevotellaceae bacterium]|nr:hypothetical protein [Prevotellaceae bacterium]